MALTALAYMALPDVPPLAEQGTYNFLMQLKRVFEKMAGKGQSIERIVSQGDLENLGLSQPRWDDLRVPVSSTEVNGSNPPVDGLFKNDGTFVPGSAHAIRWLSNSNGNMEIADDPIYDTSASYTFEMWVRPQLNTKQGEIVRKQNVFELDWRNNDFPRLDMKGLQIIDSSIQVQRGNWTHFCFTVEAGSPNEIIFYINGQNAGSFTTSSSLIDNTNDFQFNRQEIIHDIDYIAFWSKVLTPAEVDARYNNGAGAQLTGTEADLKGLWELNEGTSSTFVDKTGLGNDGIITSGTEGDHWEWIDGHVAATEPGSRGVILKYFSPDNLNELYFTAQLPHEWNEGTELRPHLHWVPNADGGTGERVKWGFEYTWANVGETFGDTVVAETVGNAFNEDLIQNKHYVTQFAAMDGKNKKISSMIICRIFRDVEDAADTFPEFAGLLEFDFHYQVDSFGSRQEYIK